MEENKLKKFVEKYGEKYSERLGIDVKKEKFKWFLAALLFGAPIREENAMKTYLLFEKNGLVTPEKIIEAGWNKVVSLLDEGGYTRYDFKTADKIIEACKNIIEKGGIEKLIEKGRHALKIAKGIGDVTIDIFLRELGMPHHLSKYAIMAAKNHELLERNRIKKFEGIDEINLEIALMKLGRDYCRKNKCEECPFPCGRGEGKIYDTLSFY